MFGRKRNREPEPAAPAPHPRPAVDGGLLRRYEPPPPPPVASLNLRTAAAPGGPAILEELAAEFADRPWRGGGYGEIMAAPAAEARPPTRDAGLVIEPPPWQDMLDAGVLDVSAALAPPAPSAPIDSMSALGAIRLENEGMDAWPDWQLPAPPPAPLEAWRPEPPDWEAEERDRLARERAEREQAAQLARAELLREILSEVENEQAYPKPKRPATREGDRR